MIAVARVRAGEAGAPIQPGVDWFTTAAARRLTAEQQQGAHVVDRNVYAASEVQRALEKLFFDKCAYCEGKPVATGDWDVEHFRPKGKVAERDGHPGYYWLAYEWTNLYLSCQHCNQKRADKARWGDTSLAPGPAAGKLDQFPLVDENTRALGHGDDIALEAVLLLDPCRDDPEQHIRFSPLGDALPVAGSEKGAVSIRVFHLRRKRLKDLRRIRIERVVARLREIEKLRTFVATLVDPDSSAMGQEFLATAKVNFHAEYLANDCDFAAAGRWIVRDPASFGL